MSVFSGASRLLGGPFQFATSSAPAPVAALISSVNAEGWSGEWAGGSPPAFAPDTSPQSTIWLRPGFDGTGAAVTYSEQRIYTRSKRNPYPNQATDTAMTVAFDNYVYATDTSAGIVNNSTETSPKPVAAWVMPDRRLVSDNIRWEIIAFHRDFRAGRQVACVRVRATDGTTTTPWQTVAATVRSTLVQDANPIEVYAGDLDVSALATGLVTLQAQVFPWIGGTASVLDSADQTAAREFSARYFLKNVSRAASPPLAYVASGGSDTTGEWSAGATMAAMLPFATVGGALTAITDSLRGSATGGVADGCRIRIVDTVPIGTTATARPQNVAAVVVERAPDTARASAVVTMGAAFRPRLGVGTLTAPLTEGALTFHDVTINRTGAFAFTGEAATQLQVRFRDAVVTNSSGNTWLANSHDYYFGLAITGTTPALGATALQRRLMRGLAVDLANAGPEAWITVGCSLTRSAASTLSDPTKGAIWYANRFLSPASTNAPITVAANAAGDTIAGVVVVQNLIEETHTSSSSPGLRVSSDGANGNTLHTILAYNTITGYGALGRCNVFYDESSGTNRRTHRLIRDAGNIYVQLNTKGDVFYAATDAAEAPNRLGQFAYHHGVGCAGNWVQYRVNTPNPFSEFQAYPGLGSKIGTDPQSPQAAPATIWIDYRGTTGSGGTPTAGAGGGDYRLASGAPVRGIVLVRGLTLDLLGQARPSSGNDSAGAYI